MAIQQNTFEGGTDETTISAANSGGASGDAFGTPVIGSGAALVFDTAFAAHGSLSMRSSTGVSSVSSYAPWTLASVTSDYGRAYVRVGSAPGTERYLLAYRSGAGQALRIGIDSTGHIVLRNAANGLIGTSTTALSFAAWFRLEWQVTFSATVGAVVLRIYTSMDSATITETMSYSALVLTASSDQFRAGVPVSAASQPDAWIDNLAVGGSTWFGPTATPGTYVHAWVGAPDPAGFRVMGKLAAASSVELVVATDAAMASPVGTFGPVVPDAQGYADITATGLTAGTQYWWQLQDIGVPLGSIGKAKTLPAAGLPADFDFAFGGCTLNNSSRREAFDDIRSWGADFLIHLGDLHYRDPNTSTVSTHRGHLETQILGAAGLAEVLREVPTIYCRSDHDAGPGDNLDSNTASNQASIDAYKQVVPAHTLAYASLPTKGLWTSWVVGRVRFILLDIRNMDRSAGLGTQGPTKTMLGATQLAWLLTQLDQAEPLKVIITDVAWMGSNPDPITEAQDKWPAYSNERQTIIDYVTAGGINVLMLHSDSHCLARATPAQNTLGAWPIYCAAPFGNIGGGRYLSTFSEYYSTGSSDQGSQYGRVTITDTGSVITATYVGYDALTGTARITQTDSWTTDDPATTIGYVSEAHVINGVTATTAITVAKPAGTIAGDDMIAVIAHLKTDSPETTITGVPAGWNLLGTTTDGTGLRLAVYHRTAGASESGSYTWTISSAFKNVAAILTYRGLSTSEPVLDFGIVDGATGTAHATPSVTSLVDDWLLSIAAARHTHTGAATTWTSSTGGDAERVEQSSNAGSLDITLAVYDSGEPVTDGAHTRTLTASQSQSLVVTASVVLRAGAEAIPELPARWGIPAIIT